jgi:hypothetical protein
MSLREREACHSLSRGSSSEQGHAGFFLRLLLFTTLQDRVTPAC